MEETPTTQSVRIGDEIRAYFDKKGFTQSQVAERLNASQSLISARLRGVRPFGKLAARRWHDEFGFNVEFLLTGEGSLINETPAVEVQTANAPTGEGFFARLCHDLMAQIVERDRRICCLEEELRNAKANNNGTLQG